MKMARQVYYISRQALDELTSQPGLDYFVTNCAIYYEEGGHHDDRKPLKLVRSIKSELTKTDAIFLAKETIGSARPWYSGLVLFLEQLGLIEFKAEDSNSKIPLGFTFIYSKRDQIEEVFDALHAQGFKVSK
jgi:hypothetical protein